MYRFVFCLIYGQAEGSIVITRLVHVAHAPSHWLQQNKTHTCNTPAQSIKFYLYIVLCQQYNSTDIISLSYTLPTMNNKLIILQLHVYEMYYFLQQVLAIFLIKYFFLIN